jgi:hypothetical protein
MCVGESGRDAAPHRLAAAKPVGKQNHRPTVAQGGDVVAFVDVYGLSLKVRMLKIVLECGGLEVFKKEDLPRAFPLHGCSPFWTVGGAKFLIQPGFDQGLPGC